MGKHNSFQLAGLSEVMKDYNDQILQYFNSISAISNIKQQVSTQGNFKKQKSVHYTVITATIAKSLYSTATYKFGSNFIFVTL